MPARTNCTPRTRRLKYSVTVLRLACDPVYSRGLTKFVACGEKTTPARRDITNSDGQPFPIENISGGHMQASER